MYYVYRVHIAPARGTRSETDRLLPHSKDVPGYSDLEDAIRAMRGYDPSRAARLEVREVVGSHTYTVAKWELDTSRADTGRGFAPRRVRHSHSVTSLPILTRPLGPTTTPQEASSDPVVVPQERGPLIDPVSYNRVVVASRPVLDSNGKPNSRAYRRRSRRIAAGQATPKPEPTFPAAPERRPVQPPPVRIPHSVSVQVAPRAPLRVRVSGTHSPLARLDAHDVRPVGQRIDGTPTTDATPVPPAIQRELWEQERLQLERFDHETRLSEDTRGLPHPSIRKGRQFKRKMITRTAVEHAEPVGRAGYDPRCFAQPLSAEPLTGRNCPSATEPATWIDGYRPVY